MYTAKTTLQKITAALIVLPLFCLCFAVQGQAAGVISGRYLTKTDMKLTLEIQIGEPAPVTLIIIQHLPQGTAPTAAAPPYKKYNAQKGEVRWLLRKVKTGTVHITLELNSPVPPDKIHAEIRCMDPATGRPVTTLVQ
jgi:hypothetical protein